MAEDRPEGDQLTRASEVVEFVVKLVVAAVAVVYVVGFVTSTAFLSSYGIAAVELLQPQYVGAGVWTLLPLAVVCVIYHAFNLNVPVLNILKLHGSEGWLMKSAKVLGQSAIPVAVLEAVFVALSFNFAWVAVAVGPRFSTPSLSTGITAFFIATITVAICRWVGLKAFRSSKRFWFENDAKQRSQYLSQAVMYTFWVIAFFFGYVTFFAVFIFGLIPAQVGGGKPTLVQFVLNPAESTEATTVPATQLDVSTESYLTPEKQGGRRSVPHWLFLTTDEDFIVYEKGVRGASVFPKSLVDGYVVIRDK